MGSTGSSLLIIVGVIAVAGVLFVMLITSSNSKNVIIPTNELRAIKEELRVYLQDDQLDYSVVVAIKERWNKDINSSDSLFRSKNQNFSKEHAELVRGAVDLLKQDFKEACQSMEKLKDLLDESLSKDVLAVNKIKASMTELMSSVENDDDEDGIDSLEVMLETLEAGIKKKEADNQKLEHSLKKYSNM